MSPSTESDLATLNRDIARLETDAARLEIERRAAAKAVRRLRRRRAYLLSAHRFRAPAASIDNWPLLVFTIGPLAVGVLVFILVSLLLDAWSLAFGGFVLGALAGAGLFATLLHQPDDALLPMEIHQSEAKCQIERSRLEEILGQLAAANERLAALQKERRALATGERLQRAMLLQRNWKAMHDAEWEDYVVEVCRTLGANVQRTQSAGQNASRPGSSPAVARALARAADNTLVVTFSPRRIAVATPSGIRPFHTAAVQQLINGLGQQGCDAAAIITNTRLTTGGKELATARNCTLIGEDEFPDFVMGKITL
jgi:hypothetical protein